MNIIPCHLCGSENVTLEKIHSAQLYYLKCQSCGLKSIKAYDPLECADSWNDGIDSYKADSEIPKEELML